MTSKIFMQEHDNQLRNNTIHLLTMTIKGRILVFEFFQVVEKIFNQPSSKVKLV